MRVQYIDHSCFFLESDSCCLLFDYFRGQVPPLPAGKPLYVFASHRHGDHFSPEIFHLNAEAWILGRDFSLSPGIRVKYGLDEIRFARCHRMRTDEELTIGPLRILALRSTDEGAAFRIHVDSRVIYHAGDLNQWVWREDAHYDRQMTTDYLREIEKLRGMAIDLAFLPVDPRQGEDFYLGADSFIRMHRPKHVFPMHLWGDYDAVRRFRDHACAAVYRNSIIEIHGEGDCFEV